MTLVTFFTTNTAIYAQTIDPTTWQAGATGLRSTNNELHLTSGLTTLIKTDAIPFVKLQGGVKDGGWSHLSGPTMIDLGEIKNPGVTSATLGTENTDWAHNQMLFTTNLGNTINVWVSRLFPAVLIQNNTSTLRLFSGNLSGSYIAPGPWAPYPPYVYNRTAAPSNPKYVAFHTASGYQVRALFGSATDLTTMDQNWILVWYGSNSHFVETKTPLGVSVVPHANAYQADAPMLIKFQNNPTGIVHSSEGGVDLTFSINSGYTSFMPLLGREYPASSVTESWGISGNLPADILAKISFWVAGNRLCSYPTTVSESYNYVSSTDTTEVTDTITYLNVCAGGSDTSGFAVLPPILTISRSTPDANNNTNPLGINVSATVVDANYPTEFGPIQGVDNTNTYTWSVAGLKKYTDNKRIAGAGNAPTELIEELGKEVDAATSSGHFKPWAFMGNSPRNSGKSDIYFANPAETIYSLGEVLPVVPEPQKTSLISYLRRERTDYPPETTYDLTSTNGVQRAPFSGTNYNTFGPLYDVLLKRVPLYSFLSLSRYYQVVGEAIPGSVMAAAAGSLNADMAEQDIATFSWFHGKGQKRAAIVSTNRHLSGLIGFIQLAKASGNSNEGLGRALLAKAVVNRIGMVKYPRYLYRANLTVLPGQPDWMPRYSAGSWEGQIWDYNWSIAFDDLRQVVLMDQLEVYLFGHSGFWDPLTPPSLIWERDWNYLNSAYLVAYRDLAPEAMRILKDYAKEESEIYLNKFTTLFPNWYAPLTEGLFGSEHETNAPVDSYQTFMAKAWLQGDSADNLRRYTSIPWLFSGDFFYLHKLAETIKAYQGWKWEDEDIGVGIPGDVNYDAQVDVLDIQACVNHILGIQDLGSRADVNSDGSVNVLDVQSIVNIILGIGG